MSLPTKEFHHIPSNISTMGDGSPLFSFRSQYRICRDLNLVGLSEGPEEIMEMAFPNEKYRAYVAEHGKPPVFRTSTCKRFGGLCSSGNEQCRTLRDSARHGLSRPLLDTKKP